jgi:large subunit ribosomal protein L22
VSPPDQTPNPEQPAEPAASGHTPPEGGWDSLKVDDLRAELEARDLPTAGTKPELVARLEEDDAAPAAEEAPAPEAAPAAEAAGEPVAEEVLPPEEPAEEPSADEVEQAGAPSALEVAPEDDEVDEDEGEEVDEDEGEVEEDEGDAVAGPATSRRGSAETSTGERRAAPRLPEDGAVVVRARSKYVRKAPRKARLVMDHIRGKEVEQARAILTHAPRAVADDILKLLNSAVANAESNYELGPDELRVRKAFVDEGPTIKRFRPRALGRATRIAKRTSHMTIELTTTGDGR